MGGSTESGEAMLNYRGSIGIGASSLRERVKTALSKSDKSRHLPQVGSEASRSSGYWPSREQLMATGRWKSRLDAIGCSDRIFAAAATAQIAPAFGPTLALDAFVNDITHAAGAASPDPFETGAPGLPPVPTGVRAYAAGRISQALLACTGVTPEFIDKARLSVQLTSALLDRLQRMMCTGMIFDMRHRRALGELIGDTPEARFADYSLRTVRAAAWHRQFLCQYPVLTRQLYIAVHAWCVSIERLIARWMRDCDLIERLDWFGGAPLGRLTAVHGPLGDLHRGGQAVCQLEFERGHRLMYKPRSVQADLTFASVLRWLDARGVEPRIAPTCMVDRESYAWCRHVERHECESLEEVERFYKRAGIHLCVLYVLGARDVLPGNVIASGEQQCLIDLECLMTPVCTHADAVSTTKAHAVLVDSVLAIGMLPRWSRGSDLESGVRLSALHVVGGQRLSADELHWESCGRDDIERVASPSIVDSSEAHLPLFEGAPVPVDQFEDAFVDAFCSTYRLIQAHRDDFFREGGPISGLGAASCRILVRSTRDYARMQFGMTHSDLIRSSHDADRFLETLFIAGGGTVPEAVTQAEVDQLWDGDIPFFCMRGNSRDLLDGEGALIVPNYALHSPVASVWQRVTQLSEGDCARQAAIIRTALAVGEAKRLSVRAKVDQQSSARPEGGDAPPTRAEMLAEAERIGSAIIDASVQDDHTMSWIGIAATVDGKGEVASLDLGLDDGAEGVALLLVQLYSATQRSCFRNAAEKIINGTCVPAMEALAQRTPSSLRALVHRFPSAMRFPASTLYCLMHVDGSFGSAYLASDLLEGGVRALECGLDCRFVSDFSHGASGLIGVLLDLHDWTGNDRALALAVRYGDLLRMCAQGSARGVRWKEPNGGTLETGFGRGLAGVASMLLRLGGVTCDATYRTVAYDVLALERSILARRIGRLRGKRAPHAETTDVGWARGVAGMVLGRLELIRACGADPAIAVDLDDMIRLCLRPKSPMTDTLCDGTFGIIDIVFSAARDQMRGDWSEAATARLAACWANFGATRSWRLGNATSDIGRPGLFSGLAGIGHALLRVTNPETVPSALSLQGPLCGPRGCVP